MTTRLALFLAGLFASGVIAVATSLGSWAGTPDRPILLGAVLFTYFLGLALGWLMFARKG